MEMKYHYLGELMRVNLAAPGYSLALRLSRSKSDSALKRGPYAAGLG